MIRRLRTLLRIDSAGCLVLGAAVATFAGRLADTVGIDNAVAVRSVGVLLVVYAIALARLARAAPRVVETTGRVTAVTDAAWVVATVALASAEVFSDRGDIVMTTLAIAVAAMGVSKVIALRALTGSAVHGDLARAN